MLLVDVGYFDYICQASATLDAPPYYSVAALSDLLLQLEVLLERLLRGRDSLFNVRSQCRYAQFWQVRVRLGKSRDWLE